MSFSRGGIWLWLNVFLCLIRSLDLTGPLLVGGVPKLPEDFPVRNQQFMGCMKNLRIDNQYVDMASYIANNGTLPGSRPSALLLLSLLVEQWVVKKPTEEITVMKTAGRESQREMMAVPAMNI